MLTGTASVDLLAEGTATIPTWEIEPAVLDGVEVLQAMFELPTASRQVLLPPGLHPTNPPTAVLQVWRCADSPWGSFSLAQARVQCRSGLRPRGFVLGAVVDGAAAAGGLAAGWGFAARPGEVRLRRGYDATSAEVVLDGRTVLALTAADPEPLDPGDLAYSTTLTLAHTPNGLRLVQVEPEHRVERSERVRPALRAFEPAGWGSALLDPRYPVSASIAVGSVTMAPVRYCCRPDVLAFEGTEAVR